LGFFSLGLREAQMIFTVRNVIDKTMHPIAMYSGRVRMTYHHDPKIASGTLLWLTVCLTISSTAWPTAIP